jgi:uncharacterized spore protein YtfJ
VGKSDERDAAARGELTSREAGRAAVGPLASGDVSGLVEGTVSELARMLDSRQVIGEPLKIGEATLIPLLSMGFGFGAGGGGGNDRSAGGGGGGGVGGGGVKPIAVIIIDPQGVRLEPIPEAPSGLGKLAGAIGEALEKRNAKQGSGD